MRYFFCFMAMVVVAWGQYSPPAEDERSAFGKGQQAIVGSRTFSGALISTGTFSATNTVWLKGYTVDSFGASLLTATSAGDIRSKLGLGGAATLSVGTTNGTVAAGNDSRIVNAVQQSGAATLSSVTVTGMLSGNTGTTMDLHGYNNGGARVALPAGSQFLILEANAIGTRDVLMQVVTSTVSSWAMFEGWPSVAGQLAGVFFGGGNEARVPLMFGRRSEEYGRFDTSANWVVKLGNVSLTSTTAGVVMGSGALILSGTGSPEGVKTAPVGSLYLRSDGGASTTLYVKQSGTGNTGWTAK